MKKFLYTLLALCIVFGLCGCALSKDKKDVKNENVKTHSEKPLTVSYEKIDFEAKLGAGESMTCCSCSNSKMVFSVGKRNGKPEGPLVDTIYLMLYDYVNNKTPEKFVLNTNSYIYNAIPYKDGIIYSTYCIFPNEEKSKWEVNYIDKDGIKKLDEGISRTYDNMPRFAKLKHNIIYLYEDIKNGDYECGVRILSEQKIKTILTKADCKIIPGPFSSNGNQYMIMMRKDNDKYATVVVGDEKGILSETLLKHKLASYGINKDYVVCSTVIDDNHFSLLSIVLKSGTKYYTDFGIPLFRITGGMGSSMVSVDNNFKMYAIIPGDKSMKKEIPWPEGKQNGASIYYDPISPSKYIMSFDDEYYIMKIQYD